MQCLLMILSCFVQTVTANSTSEQFSEIAMSSHAQGISFFGDFWILSFRFSVNFFIILLFPREIVFWFFPKFDIFSSSWKSDTLLSEDLTKKKKMYIENLALKKCKKIISYKWNKCTVRQRLVEWYIFSKIGWENLWILETSCHKSHNSGTSLDKTWVLTISAKYLRIYGINRTIKESCVRKLWHPIRQVRILPVLDK